MGAKLLIDTIRLYEQDKITPIKQDADKATYAPMIKKERAGWILIRSHTGCIIL
jgi:methionyl-tRNA formyltransferase